MIYEKTFRQRLSMLIGEHGCDTFERLTHVNKNLLEKYLEGDSLPTLKTLDEIAQATGVSVGWLIGEEQVPQSSEHRRHEIMNESMLDIVEWINEQDDGINYWEVLKGKLAIEYPDFHRWLKEKHK